MGWRPHIALAVYPRRFCWRGWARARERRGGDQGRPFAARSTWSAQRIRGTVEARDPRVLGGGDRHGEREGRTESQRQEAGAEDAEREAAGAEEQVEVILVARERAKRVPLLSGLLKRLRG